MLVVAPASTRADSVRRAVHRGERQREINSRESIRCTSPCAALAVSAPPVARLDARSRPRDARRRLRPSRRRELSPRPYRSPTSPYPVVHLAGSHGSERDHRHRCSRRTRRPYLSARPRGHARLARSGQPTNVCAGVLMGAELAQTCRRANAWRCGRSSRRPPCSAGGSTRCTRSASSPFQGRYQLHDTQRSGCVAAMSGSSGVARRRVPSAMRGCFSNLIESAMFICLRSPRCDAATPRACCLPWPSPPWSEARSSRLLAESV